MVHTVCEILMPMGNSLWLLGQILVLSVSNTVMYYKLVYLVGAKSAGVETKTRFIVGDHSLHCL